MRTEELEKSTETELNQKLSIYYPKYVCFNGKSTYQFITGEKVNLSTHVINNNTLHQCNYGWQEKEFKLADGSTIPIFVVPSTTAIRSKPSFAFKLHYFKQLQRVLNKLRN